MPEVGTQPSRGTTSGKASRTDLPARPGAPVWLKGLAPLVLLAALVAVFIKFGPVGVFQQSFPPVEELTIERIRLPERGVMEVQVVNGGPEPVTVAQVMVDDANWVHELDGSRTIERLQRRTIRIPYPWVEGEPHVVALVTSTGLTFVGDVAVATLSPSVDARYLSTFALLGIYAGVIPVFIGLLWLPFVRSVDRRWIDFFLSLTIGLLVFLGVDALVEAIETSGRVSGAFQGPALVLFGVLGTPLVLAALGQWRGGLRRERSPIQVAALIALGIGLHNLGEGLAIGTSYATGEIALGTFLVIGFLLHNTTEGLGIVTPLADQRPRLISLILLGALAGVPTVLGAWFGGFTYSPVWTTLFFAIGVGAIVAVVYELWRLFRRRSGAGLTAPLNVAGLLLGMVIMYATGLLVPA
ncbi:MAG TPA: ZIP family metal transporter [Gemmatimonadales bacterium]|nr:ZIP family metal transporter [Gemmatimonadales bacterium]